MSSAADVRVRRNGKLWFPVATSESNEAARKHVAFHEAGHAVFAVLARYEITGLIIEIENAQTCVKDFGDLESIAGLESRIKHIIAGVDAGNLFAPFPDGSVAVHDEPSADDADPGCDNSRVGTDLTKLAALTSGDPETIFNRLREETRSEMSKSGVRLAIQDLAEVLIEFEQHGNTALRGAIVTTIVKNALESCEVGATDEAREKRASYLRQVKACVSPTPKG